MKLPKNFTLCLILTLGPPYSEFLVIIFLIMQVSPIFVRYWVPMKQGKMKRFNNNCIGRNQYLTQVLYVPYCDLKALKFIHLL